ncbi:hypothetical protein HK099_008256, partial [Clydaea vesicula]
PTFTGGLKFLKKLEKESRPLKLSDESYNNPHQGVSTKFNNLKVGLVAKINANNVKGSFLRTLVYEMKTKEEADLFLPILALWNEKASIFHPYHDGAVILEALFAIKGTEDLLLNILSDRFKYRIYPTREHLNILMTKLQKIHFKKKDEESLNNLYKLFCISIYHDILPTSTTYSKLISTGIFGETEDGKNKSLKTLQELKSFNLKLNFESSLAFSYLKFKQDDLNECLNILIKNNKNLNDSRFFKLFFILNFKLKNFDECFNNLKALFEFENLNNSKKFKNLTKNFNKEELNFFKFFPMIKKFDSILIEFLENLKSSDQKDLLALFLKTKAILVHSTENAGFAESEKIKEYLKAV